MSKIFKVGDRVKRDPNKNVVYSYVKLDKVYTVSSVGNADEWNDNKPNWLKFKEVSQSNVDFYAYNPDNFVLVEEAFEVGYIVTSTYPQGYHKAVGYNPTSSWYTTEKKFRIVEKEATIDYSGLQWYGVKALDDKSGKRLTNRFPSVDLTKVEKEMVYSNNLYKTKKTLVGGHVVIGSHGINIEPYLNGSIRVSVSENVWSKKSLKEYAALLNEIADSE